MEDCKGNTLLKEIEAEQKYPNEVHEYFCILTLKQIALGILVLLATYLGMSSGKSRVARS